MCTADVASLDSLNSVAMTPRVALHHKRLYDANSLRGLVADPDDITAASVDVGSELYNLVCSYLSQHSDAESYSLHIDSQSGGCGKSGKSCSKRVTSATLGLGTFAFQWSDHKLYACHEAMGEPVGTDCGAKIFRTLTLLVPGRGNIDVLTAFGNELLEAADRTDKKMFTVYRWQVNHMYWRRDTMVNARPVESVVLPAAVKERVVTDMSDFLSEETYHWYVDHGIPYKRAYLFHGAPGAGKTSLIQALAGKYQRNVCYLSPTHPEMTDDNLKSAVQMVPSNSILVLEDIDALFGAKREKKVEKSPLTFSGLLNAIDGVGGANGQIFILTTNHRENLDPALIRNGRVDLHVEFADADKEQMQRLFLQFYPDAEPALAVKFADKLMAALGGKSVSMAALQHYFIVMRKQGAAEAAERVQAVVDEMEERKQQSEAAEAKKGTKKGSDQGTDLDSGTDSSKDSKARASTDGEKPSTPATTSTPSGAKEDGKEIHVHVHVNK